jgi:Glycosyl transferase family 2
VSRQPAPGRTRAVGIVVPVHNEEKLLHLALDALRHAIANVPTRIECRVAIVLDTCNDASTAIAHRWAKTHGSRCRGALDAGALLISCGESNVGAARRHGCAALLGTWSRMNARHLWLATTDADSVVPDPWLTTQITAHEAGADLWAGRVSVTDWSAHGPATARLWNQEYGQEGAPIHGASLGMNAQAYLEIGGFRALRTGEDRDLYQRALEAGARLQHEVHVTVTTSARRQARAPLGFAHALTALESELVRGGRSRPEEVRVQSNESHGLAKVTWR